MWNSARTAISCPCSTSRPEKVAQYEKRNTSRYLRKEKAMKKRKVKDFIALDAQKLVRDCEEYLEEEKALELDLKEREEIIRKETPDDVKKKGGYL